MRNRKKKIKEKRGIQTTTELREKEEV